MTVTHTEIVAFPATLADLCRGRCRRCGFRWWSPDPVRVAREHERDCPGRPRTLWEAK